MKETEKVNPITRGLQYLWNNLGAFITWTIFLGFIAVCFLSRQAEKEAIKERISNSPEWQVETSIITGKNSLSGCTSNHVRHMDKEGYYDQNFTVIKCPLAATSTENTCGKNCTTYISIQ